MKTLKILVLSMLLLPFMAKAQTAQNQHHVTAAIKTHHQQDSLVRGVSFIAFRASVPDFKDSSKILLTRKSWILWKREAWTRLENFFNKDSLNGGWPPNYGAVTYKNVTLEPPMLIDRYGGYYTADSVFHDRGTFVCRKGVPFDKRALPDSDIKEPYRAYKILKPIANVARGVIIPWFNQPGLGIQYNLPYNIDDLLKGGYIVQISSKRPIWSSKPKKKN